MAREARSGVGTGESAVEGRRLRLGFPLRRSVNIFIQCKMIVREGNKGGGESMGKEGGREGGSSRKSVVYLVLI